jgi:hypothetical protein
MKITAPEQELLDLLNKPEDEQLQTLQNYGVCIIRPDTNEAGGRYWESLADIAITAESKLR